MSKTEEQKIPTKEEIIAILKEQIEIKELQATLADLNSRIAVSRAKEVEALSFLGRSQAPSQTSPGNIHTITQEDLDTNPDLVDEGIKVGDQVIIPTPEEVAAAEIEFEKKEKEKERSKRSLKKVD